MIPKTAVAVAMNVTVASPSARSFLTLFPADGERPVASNLNGVAGQSPTPNKVDAKLSADGDITLYNEAGTVNVIGDVVGYYTSSTLLELDDRIASLETGKADAADVPNVLGIGRVLGMAGGEAQFGDFEIVRDDVGVHTFTFFNAGPIDCPAGPDVPDLLSVVMFTRLGGEDSAGIEATD